MAGFCIRILLVERFFGYVWNAFVKRGKIRINSRKVKAGAELRGGHGGGVF